MRTGSILLLVLLALYGCKRNFREVTEIGLFTPYFFNPEELNGQVRTLTERYYLAVPADSDFVRGPRITLAMRDSIKWSNDFIIHFNEAGLITSTSFIDENDSIISTWDMEIADKRIVSATWSDHGGPNTLIRLLYDRKGELEELGQYRAGTDTLNQTVRFNRDEKGRVTRWDYLTNTGDTTMSYVFNLSGEGRRMGYRQLNRRKRVLNSTEFVYDNRGFTTEQITFNSAGIPYTFTYRFTLDERGNWIRALASSDKWTVLQEREMVYY